MAGSEAIRTTRSACAFWPSASRAPADLKKMQSNTRRIYILIQGQDKKYEKEKMISMTKIGQEEQIILEPGIGIKFYNIYLR